MNPFTPQRNPNQWITCPVCWELVPPYKGIHTYCESELAEELGLTTVSITADTLQQGF